MLVLAVLLPPSSKLSKCVITTPHIRLLKVIRMLRHMDGQDTGGEGRPGGCRLGECGKQRKTPSVITS